MKKWGREKILGVVVLGCAALFVGGLLIKGMILKPADDLHKQKLQLESKLKKIEKERDQYAIAEKELQTAAQKMVSSNLDQANGLMGEVLNELIQKMELNPRQFTRSPVGPNRLRGGREIGWSVQGEGPLDRVVDLLYQLENLPSFHKLEGVKLSALSQPGWVKVGFRYMTLVLEPAPSGVATNTVSSLTELEVDEADHQLYSGIAVRDLFRAYIKRPEGAVAPSELTAENATTPPAFRPEIYKAVSISEWGGKSEIHLLNIETGGIQVYVPGDGIEGWTIVAVDYRRLPLPDSILYSDSRVILKNSEGYWALEQGHTLAQLHRMSENELPPSVKSENSFDKK